MPDVQKKRDGYPYPFPYPRDKKGKDGKYLKLAVDVSSLEKKPVRFDMQKKDKYPYPYPYAGDKKSAVKLEDKPVIMLLEMCSNVDNCMIMGMDDVPDNYLELAETCKYAEENGCPLFLKCFEQGESKDIGWQEVFEIDDSDVLDVIVENFHKIDNLMPPVVLGHDEEQAILQNSGYPSAGWVTDVKRKNATNVLLAKFDRVPLEVVQLIESGAYSKISAELYVDYVDNDGAHYGPALRRVSILGADIPQIKTLDDLAVIYNSEGKLPIKTFTMEKHMETQGKEVPKTSDAAVLKLQEDVKSFKEQVLKLQEDATKEKQVSEQKILTLSEQLTTTNQKLSLATEALANTKKERILNDLGQTFTPAVMEDVSKILTFSDDDPVLKVIKLFETHLKAGSLLKPEIKKPIVPTSDPEGHVTGDPIEGLHRKIVAYAENAKITYEDAYNKMLTQGLVKI